MVVAEVKVEIVVAATAVVLELAEVVVVNKAFVAERVDSGGGRNGGRCDGGNHGNGGKSGGGSSG